MQTIRIAVTGSVDASKSTLIGVLKTGLLDDGNGSRRSDIVSLKHERETGRTSYINDINIPSTNPNPIHLIDLAGHEKYLRTTLDGLTSYFPDYAFVVINANATNKRIDKITTEHIMICKTLLIPIIFIITKIDIAPPQLIQDTYKYLITLLRKCGYNIFYEITEPLSIVNISSKFIQSPFSIAPMLSISNVSGVGLPLLHEFISTLIPRQQNKTVNDFANENSIHKLFYIQRAYYVKGTGIVIYGLNKLEQINVNDKLLLGPFDKSYLTVRIRSIHNDNKEPIAMLSQNQYGCLAIKNTDNSIKLTKYMIKRGSIVIDKPIYVCEIDAYVHILPGHSTTINTGYSPYIHCANISTSVRLIKGDNLPIRSNSDAKLTFSLLKYQFIVPGERVIFRDGNLKAIGKILAVRTLQ